MWSVPFVCDGAGEMVFVRSIKHPKPWIWFMKIVFGQDKNLRIRRGW